MEIAKITFECFCGLLIAGLVGMLALMTFGKLSTAMPPAWMNIHLAFIFFIILPVAFFTGLMALYNWLAQNTG